MTGRARVNRVRALAMFSLSVGAGYVTVCLIDKYLNGNRLWMWQFCPTPQSIPEELVQEGRAKGWL